MSKHQATKEEQNWNKRMAKSNTTGLKGISRKKDGRYEAYYSKDYLGSSMDFFEVCCMRKAAEVLQYGT